MARRKAFSPREIDQAIQRNLDRLRKPGVLIVRPGYEITGDQLTGKQAIVATVNAKKSEADLLKKDLLPDRLGGYPVDVREASGYQRLRASDPAAAAIAQVYERPEQRDPEWPKEREMPSGKLISAHSSTIQKRLRESITQEPSTHRALAAVQAKGKSDLQLQYTPPEGAPPLEPAKYNATIIAHVSPDAGFVTLSKFLADTDESLVIGMYDFTSGPILSEFLSDLSGNRSLQMVLDNPAPNDTRDQLDGVTVEELQSNLSERAKIARALVRTDKFASKWMFPYAYHIKVIVRDGKVLWLSSGNLNNSNQPDPSRPPHKEDRDWHLIVENKELADVFAYYLNYDYNSAIKWQNPHPDEIEKAIEDALAKKGELTNPYPSTPAPPVKNPVAPEPFEVVDATITPLLTPDKLPNGQPQYLTKITELINSAEKSIYIQLQYIEASKGDGSEYEKLLQTIAKKISAGVKVVLIEDNHYGIKWVEKMKAEGVDLTDNIALQYKDYNVHNKGFVIDSKTVVVSSQNFSPSGVETNRDAGLIIEDQPKIAKYFESVFLDDFKARTRPASAVRAEAPSPGRRKKKTGTAQKTKTGTHARGRGKG